MVQHPLGRTGARVSSIGFGAFKIGRNTGVKYPSGYDLPDEDEAARLLHAVLDLGINIIDTAPAYGVSEERIGRALASRRSEYLLSTKVGETFEDGASTYDFSRAAVLRSVERSLQRLGTEVIDLLSVHSDGRDREIIEETDIVETMHALRERGVARWLGFSGKTTEGARLATAWADVLMVEYNQLDTSHDAVMTQAASEGVGVIIKKGLASGRLPAEEAIPFALRHAAVSTLVVGGLNMEHLRRNIRIANETASEV